MERKLKKRLVFALAVFLVFTYISVSFASFFQTTYDDCNSSPDVDHDLFSEDVSAGDIVGNGSDYIIDHSTTAEMTLDTAGIKEDFTAYLRSSRVHPR